MISTEGNKQDAELYKKMENFIDLYASFGITLRNFGPIGDLCR